MAEMLLLPVSENKCPRYWNFTSDFDFDLSTVSAGAGRGLYHTSSTKSL